MVSVLLRHWFQTLWPIPIAPGDRSSGLSVPDDSPLSTHGRQANKAGLTLAPSTSPATPAAHCTICMLARKVSKAWGIPALTQPQSAPPTLRPDLVSYSGLDALRTVWTPAWILSHSDPPCLCMGITQNTSPRKELGHTFSPLPRSPAHRPALSDMRLRPWWPGGHVAAPSVSCPGAHSTTGAVIVKTGLSFPLSRFK